jgi:predicted RNA-binding Zn-ribbon protein involved in translation (DUF1610 family)
MPKGQDKSSGMGAGMGRGAGRSGVGGGMGGKKRGGPGGNCVCPNCSEKVIHRQGVPCYSLKCPKCGSAMMRE